MTMMMMDQWLIQFLRVVCPFQYDWQLNFLMSWWPPPWKILTLIIQEERLSLSSVKEKTFSGKRNKIIHWSHLVFARYVCMYVSLFLAIVWKI